MTIFAVPSEMRDGLRCTRLTRPGSGPRAGRSCGGRCVGGGLEGASGSQGAGESLRDERYRVKGVIAPRRSCLLGRMPARPLHGAQQAANWAAGDCAGP